MLNSGTKAGKKASGGQCGGMSGCSPRHCFLRSFEEYRDSEGRCGHILVFDRTFGVPQSCVLSPALFLITYNTGKHHLSFFDIYIPPSAPPTMTIFPEIPANDNKGITKAIAKSNDYGNGPVKYPL
jgi:hypothetical protein